MPSRICFGYRATWFSVHPWAYHATKKFIAPVEIQPGGFKFIEGIRITTYNIAFLFHIPARPPRLVQGIVFRDCLATLSFSGLENLIFYVENDPTGVISLLSTNFQLVFGTILPFLMIISSNIVIISTIKSATRTRMKLQAQQRKEKPEQERNESGYLTRMLIFVSIAYVITSIPYRLFVVALLIPQVAAQIDLTDICDFTLYNVTIMSFYSLWIWNYAVNFYMYVVGGGKRYRKDIKEVLGTLIGTFTRKVP
jgi:hypothetical protein